MSKKSGYILVFTIILVLILSITFSLIARMNFFRLEDRCLIYKAEYLLKEIEKNLTTKDFETSDFYVKFYKFDNKIVAKVSAKNAPITKTKIFYKKF